MARKLKIFNGASASTSHKYSAENLNKIINVLITKYTGLNEGNYLERINILKEIYKFASLDPDLYKKRIADTLLSLSSCYGALREYDQSLSYANKLLELFYSDPNYDIKKIAAKAIVHIAINQKRTKDLQAAISTYDHAIAFLGELKDDESQEIYARAVFNKANLFTESNNFDGALSLYDQLTELAENGNNAIQKYAADSYLNKANMLLNAKKYDKVITTADAGFKSFADNKDSNIINKVIGLLVIKAIAPSLF